MRVCIISSFLEFISLLLTMKIENEDNSSAFEETHPLLKLIYVLWIRVIRIIAIHESSIAELSFIEIL